MYYTANIQYAFFSVEYIMREVNWGWLIRYIHSNGASMFFFIIYIHLSRSLIYGSFIYPREFLWVSGIIILILLIFTGFLGYVLPWGQMSFWAATVITNILSAIPFFGYNLVEWIWGGFSINNATLNRFFSFHYLLPFLILGLVFLHFIFLHEFGSNNPLGICFKADSVSLSYIFILKDFFFFIVFLFIYLFFVFFMPNILGHSDNYIMANFLITPEHIVPEWYFWIYYAILRSVKSKFWGIILLFFFFFILLVLPFFFKFYVRCFLFFPLLKQGFFFFFINCLLLFWLGGRSIEYPYDVLGQIFTFFYFFFFFFFLSFWNELNIFFIFGFYYFYNFNSFILLSKFEFKV